jgi:hypothetical protein
MEDDYVDKDSEADKDDVDHRDSHMHACAGARAATMLPTAVVHGVPRAIVASRTVRGPSLGGSRVLVAVIVLIFLMMTFGALFLVPDLGPADVEAQAGGVGVPDDFAAAVAAEQPTRDIVDRADRRIDPFAARKRLTANLGSIVDAAVRRRLGTGDSNAQPDFEQRAEVPEPLRREPAPQRGPDDQPPPVPEEPEPVRQPELAEPAIVPAAAGDEGAAEETTEDPQARERQAFVKNVRLVRDQEQALC